MRVVQSISRCHFYTKFCFLLLIVLVHCVGAPVIPKKSLVFCPYNGRVCCDSSKDVQLHKAFEGMKISDTSCSSAVKSILCSVSFLIFIIFLYLGLFKSIVVHLCWILREKFTTFRGSHILEEFKLNSSYMLVEIEVGAFKKFSPSVFS